MDYYWSAVVFIFGAIVGSFLNVVIYRLHTGKSLNGRSHCLSCNEQLQWYELLPVVSYLALRAHCRTCSSFIPMRYLLVELLTAFSFLLLWLGFTGDLVLLGLHFALAALLIVIVVYDIYHTIIPDEMVYGLVGVGVLILLYQFFLLSYDTDLLLMHLLAAVLSASFFALFWYVSKGQWMGLGDAKLMFPLGLVLGLSGALSAIVFAFWIGAIVSLGLIAFQRVAKAGKTRLTFFRVPLTIKSEVPFAPFLVLGFVFAYFFHVSIFTITEMFFPF